MPTGARLALFTLLVALACFGGWLAGDAFGPEPPAASPDAANHDTGHP